MRVNQAGGGGRWGGGPRAGGEVRPGAWWRPCSGVRRVLESGWGLCLHRAIAQSARRGLGPGGRWAPTVQTGKGQQVELSSCMNAGLPGLGVSSAGIQPPRDCPAGGCTLERVRERSFAGPAVAPRLACSPAPTREGQPPAGEP